MRIVLTDERDGGAQGLDLFYEGGIEAFVDYLDRNKTALHNPPVSIRGEKDGITVEVAMQWNDSYHETMLLLHQQHPAARRRHAPGRLPRRADAHVNKYADESGPRQEGEGRA